MIDLGTRVDRIHVAMITRHLTETKVNLKVLPDMADVFNLGEVELLGSQADGAACWSPWIEALSEPQPA